MNKQIEKRADEFKSCFGNGKTIYQCEAENDKIDEDNLIENQRNVITKKLQKEFKPFDVGLIWHEINELIELEIEAERECNQ